MKSKNRLDYLLNDNIIANIKDFDSTLLEINKLSFKGVFRVSIHYIRYIPTKSSNRVSIDRTDNDEDYLYLFLDDVDGQIQENDGIKYLVFASTCKNKEALKNYTKLWEETKRQIEVLNDDEPVKCKKDFMKIEFESDNNLPLSKTFNTTDMIIAVASVLESKGKYLQFFYTNARMTYKIATTRKN